MRRSQERPSGTFRGTGVSRALPEKPLRSTPFAAFSPFSTSEAFFMKALTTEAVLLAARQSSGPPSEGLQLSLCGSASSNSSDRPSPRKTIPNRWETPGFIIHPTPSTDRVSASIRRLRQPLPRPRSLSCPPSGRSRCRPSPYRNCPSRRHRRLKIHIEAEHFENAPAYLVRAGS